MGYLGRLFSYRYLNNKQLAGFDTYKYSSVDNSPLSRYVMHPLWDRMVNFVPIWVAPNLLTLIGFLCCLFNFIVFSIYDYDFYGYCFDEEHCAASGRAALRLRQHDFQLAVLKYDATSVPDDVCSCIPQWLWLVFAICQLLSHHLDGMDGKQARRTSSSTPLGELFDHGLDSCTSLLIPVSIFSLVGRSSEFGLNVYEMYGIVWLLFGFFLLAHTEKYNTGTLFLPWSYDIVQNGMTIVFFVTYLFGQGFWFVRFAWFGYQTSTAVFKVAIIAIIHVNIGSTILLSLPFTIYNISEAHSKKKLIQPDWMEGIRPVMPAVYLFLVLHIWLNNSRLALLDLEPRAFFWLTGVILSNICCRLIVMQMCKSRCEIFNPICAPLTLIVAIFSAPCSKELEAYLTLKTEVMALYVMALIATLAHIHYGVCMIRQLCDHLNIYCFNITSKPSTKKVSEKKQS